MHKIIAATCLFIFLHQGCSSAFKAPTSIEPGGFIVATPLGFESNSLSSRLANLGLAKSDDDLFFLGSHSGISYFRVTFAAHEDFQKILQEWIDHRLIDFAEGNAKHESFATLSQGDSLRQNNPDTGSSWREAIKLSQGFQLLNDMQAAPENAPIIAVLDAGIDWLHPALETSMWKNEEVPTNCQDDGFGCNSASQQRGLGNQHTHPLGTIGPNKPCAPLLAMGHGLACKHGTHTAGIIAGNSLGGYSGVCPDCKILSIKIMDFQEGQPLGIFDSSIIKALNYLNELTKRGVPIRIANASFGKFQRSQSVSQWIANLSSTNNGQGILFVAAAGNENSSIAQFPAGHPDVIGVANINPQTQNRHPQSNFGSWVDISAPGTDNTICRSGKTGLMSTVPGGGYDCAQGTSVSAPVVSGVAGLVLMLDPELSTKDLRQRLLESADPKFYNNAKNAKFLRNIEKRTYPLLGAGIINARAAINGTSPASGLRVGKNQKRVTSSCGSLGQTSQGIALLVFLIPLFGCRKSLRI